MPLSIAACRTVLPFSTVTCRPSIVSVTVSISLDRSYQGRVRRFLAKSPAVGRPGEGCRRPVDSREAGSRAVDISRERRRVVAADSSRAQRSVERHRISMTLSVTATTTSTRASIGVLERDGDRQVEHLAGLLEAAKRSTCRLRRGSTR